MTLQIRCCASNLFQFQYLNRLVEEKNSGNAIQVEGCLGYCGTCRTEAYWLREGQMERMQSREAAAITGKIITDGLDLKPKPDA